jgi:hypothetical protein
MPYSRDPIQVLIKPVLIQNLSQPVVRSIPNSLDYHHCWRSTDPAAALVSARFHGVKNDSDTSSDAQHHERSSFLLTDVRGRRLGTGLRTGTLQRRVGSVNCARQRSGPHATSRQSACVIRPHPPKPAKCSWGNGLCEHAGPPRLGQLLLNVCFQLLPQTIRTGSSTPLPPDNGNRAGGIAETGRTQWDIPRLPVVPDRGSRDRERFVSEASRLCLVPVGPRASPVQAVLRYSSIHLVARFRRRKRA